MREECAPSVNIHGGTASLDFLNVLFRNARTYSKFTRGSVTDEQLCAIYDLMKHGPTTANSQPQRIVFLKSGASKERLRPFLSQNNLEKTIAAPVVAILAFDIRFYEELPRLYHVPGAQRWYDSPPDHVRTTALRNASLQGAYFMLAARAVGLDCGPMSGFDNTKLDAEFFPEGRLKSNFLCMLGKGDSSDLPPKNYRFRFEEVCSIF